MAQSSASAHPNSTNPTSVTLKRKRTDRPPDHLVLEPTAETNQAQRIRYVRQRRGSYDGSLTSEVAADVGVKRTFHLSVNPGSESESASTGERPVKSLKNRNGVKNGKVRGRNHRAMFIEAASEPASAPRETRNDPISATATLGPSYKRPGKGAALPRTVPASGEVQLTAKAERWAREMHDEALGAGTGAGLASEAGEKQQGYGPNGTAQLQGDGRRRVKSPPLAAGGRAAEWHRRRLGAAPVRTNGNGTEAMDVDVDMNSRADGNESDSDEYVYDTYILHAPPPTNTQSDPFFDANALDLAGNIGYIHFPTPQEQALWSSYVLAGSDVGSEDEDGEGRGADGARGAFAAGEDEDENAEGYWGADYPEDEEGDGDEEEEDEGLGLQGVPGGNSQWGRGSRRRWGDDYDDYDDDRDDEDGGAYSDEAGDEFSVMQPWRAQGRGKDVLRQFERFKARRREMGFAHEDSGPGDGDEEMF